MSGNRSLGLSFVSGWNGKGSLLVLPCGLRLCVNCGVRDADADPNHQEKCKNNNNSFDETEGSGGTSKRQADDFQCDSGNEHPISKLRRITLSPSRSNLADEGSVLSDVTNKDLPSPRGGDWDCLACGHSGCRFEMGVTIMNAYDGQENEWDPLEIDWKGTENPNTKFDEIKICLACAVRSALTSKGMFSIHKFIGGDSFEAKLKEWLVKTVIGSRSAVENLYPLLRRAVKETLRYKRQVSLTRMRDFYVDWEATNRMTTDRKMWAAPLKRQMFEFASNSSPVQIPSADLSKKEPIVVLGWVVSKLVPVLMDDPTKGYRNIIAKKPIGDYVTPSDIAFVVLALEHSIVQWNKMVDFQLETGGRTMSDEFVRVLEGLVYQDGIAGQAAKRRFDSLRIYFYLNFFSGINDSKANMGRLQSVVDMGADFELEQLKKMVKEHDKNRRELPSDDKVVSDVAHRIFYWMQ